jgi:hypothetical protein
MWIKNLLLFIRCQELRMSGSLSLTISKPFCIKCHNCSNNKQVKVFCIFSGLHKGGFSWNRPSLSFNIVFTYTWCSSGVIAFQNVREISELSHWSILSSNLIGYNFALFLTNGHSCRVGKEETFGRNYRNFK